MSKKKRISLIKILRLSQAVVLSKHIYNIYQNMASYLVPRMGLEPTQAKA